MPRWRCVGRNVQLDTMDCLLLLLTVCQDIYRIMNRRANVKLCIEKSFLKNVIHFIKLDVYRSYINRYNVYSEA